MTNILKNSIFLGLLLFCLYIPGEAEAVWVFEDLFNSDTKSTGDLNSQDGWSGDTDYDVVTTDPYEGDQHVTVTNGNGLIANTFTALTAGTFYIAMQKNNYVSDDGIRLYTTTNAIAIYPRFQGNNFLATDGAGTVAIIENFSQSAWYLFEFILNGDNTYNVRYHNGTSWSSSFGPYDYTNTGSVDDISFVAGGPGGSTHTAYYDTVTDTNPIAEEATTPYVAPPLFFLR